MNHALTDSANAYAATQLQPVRLLIQQRHALDPTPLIPLRQEEWVVLEELIALAYMAGSIAGMDQAIQQVAAKLLMENLGGNHEA